MRQPDQVKSGGAGHDLQPEVLLSTLQIGVNQTARTSSLVTALWWHCSPGASPVSSRRRTRCAPLVDVRSWSPTDVADAAQVDAAADRADAELGPIDVWVNDAMATIFAPVSEIRADEFRRATEVTHLATVHGTTAALRRMRSRDRRHDRADRIGARVPSDPAAVRVLRRQVRRRADSPTRCARNSCTGRNRLHRGWEFTQTSFIDSTVVAALVRRSRAGETLLLVVPRGSAVRRTLDLIGVTDLLRTFETRDEAVAGGSTRGRATGLE